MISIIAWRTCKSKTVISTSSNSHYFDTTTTSTRVFKLYFHRKKLIILRTKSKPSKHSSTPRVNTSISYKNTTKSNPQSITTETYTLQLHSARIQFLVSLYWMGLPERSRVCDSPEAMSTTLRDGLWEFREVTVASIVSDERRHRNTSSRCYCYLLEIIRISLFCY